MEWKPTGTQVGEELEELGVPVTRETRQLLTLLATDPHALYTSISRLSESHVPSDHEIPPVDSLVERHFLSHFGHCTEPSVLRKTKPMNAQCKRLLAVLIRDIGTPVTLAELLLANGLRSGTPRRLRELEHEHGAFDIHTYSRDHVQHYVLSSPEPDTNECSRYWILANLRASDLTSERRVLGILTAFLGQPVTRRELDYVLPESRSAGRGLARAASGDTDAVVERLTSEGHEIVLDKSGYVLRGLAAS